MRKIRQRGVRSRVCSLGCPGEQQQRDGLWQGAVQEHGPQTLSCLLLVEYLFQWWRTCVSIALLASTWPQTLKASNVSAAFRQTLSEILSVAPGRHSWVLPDLLRPLSPAVGTCLISEKGCENDGSVFFIQKAYNIFVTFSYCLISFHCWCSVHNLALCPSQLKAIGIVKQFRTNYWYTQSCFPTAVFISFVDICS